jgi:hypothetical protein
VHCADRPYCCFPAGKTLSRNLGLSRQLDRLRAALPPGVVRRSKRLMTWRGLLVSMLFVHGFWVVAYLHTTGPGGIGMPLPGIQPWARLDQVAESRQNVPGAVGASMGRELSAAAAPVRTCPVDVEWGGLLREPNQGKAAVFTLYNIGGCASSAPGRSGRPSAARRLSRVGF